MEKGKTNSVAKLEPSPKKGVIAAPDFLNIITNRPSSTILLDVRSEEEAEVGVIPQSLLIPADKVLERLSEIPSNGDIVVYCRSGLRAEMVYSLLEERGYSVRYLPSTLDIKKDGSFAIID